MNTLPPSSRLAAATALRPGVPFSTRLPFGPAPKRAGAVMGNRAYIRAWAARRAANAGLPTARAT
jgi:hypothetical protein